MRSIPHQMGQISLSVVHLVVSLSMILNHGCVTTGTHSQQIGQQNSIKRQLIDRMKLSHPVMIARSDLLNCPPPQQTESSHPIELTLLLNPQELSLSSTKKQALKNWMTWLQSKRVSFALELDHDPNGRINNLEDLRDKLDTLLQQVGWPLGKPPLRVWYLSTTQDMPQNIEDLSSFENSFENGWFALHHSAFKDQLKWLGQSKNPDETQMSQSMSQSRSSPHSPKCSQIAQDLKYLQKSNTSFMSLSEATLEMIEPGIRLLKAPRPPISPTCAQLFNIKEHILKNEKHHYGVQQARWHLVLRRIKTPINSRPSSQNLDTESIEYLTLPIPTDPDETPLNWEEEGIKEMWKQRSLWWGAQGCWHRVTMDSIVTPITQKGRRWIELSDSGERLRTLELTRWQQFTQPYATWQQSSPQTALEREILYQVNLSAQGVVTALTKHQHILPHWRTTPLIAALWSKKAPQAFLLAGISSFTPYEALAQLSGDQALYQIAFEGQSTFGPLLYLPRDKKSPPPQWQTAAQSLIQATQKSKTLRDGDLITYGGEIAQARWLLGSASLTSQDPRAILKERLSRCMSVMSPSLKQRPLNAGETLHLSGGPWLGSQQHQIVAPPNQLP